MLSLINVIKKVLVSGLIISAMVAPKIFAMGPETDQWMKSAQIGPYQGDEDWAEIIRKAQEEGTLVFYTASSSNKKMVASFMKMYPKIKVELYDLGSTKTVEKIQREHNAGIYNVDFVASSGSPVVTELLNKGYIHNYVPNFLKPHLEPIDKDPLLVRSYGALALFYNIENWDSPPISNLWELTEKKWKGRVGIKSPMVSDSVFDCMMAIMENPEGMSSAYQKLTGKKLILSAGVPNASYEFIKRLINNDLVLFKSGSKVAKASGKKGQKKPMLTLSHLNYMSKNLTKGYKNYPTYNISPAAKLVFPSFLAIADRAAHPNAAKLMTVFAMGGLDLNPSTSLTPPYTSKGDQIKLQGLHSIFAPSRRISRKDIPIPAGTFNFNQIGLEWRADPMFVKTEGAKFRDFWIKEVNQ